MTHANGPAPDLSPAEAEIVARFGLDHPELEIPDEEPTA